MGHIRPLVKYHGGKGRLHQWIIGQMADHRVYFEPFGGAASVLLNKSPSEIEVYNELEPEMFNLMVTVRDDFDRFYERVSAVKYCKATFDSYLSLFRGSHDSLTRAVVFYIVKRMSRGGLCERFSWSARIYSTGPAEEHCWNTALVNLRLVHDRLQKVVLLNKDAFEILGEYLGTEDCFMYLDPPYLISTRVLKKAYDYEFCLADHLQLSDLLRNCQAKVMLSGYGSAEYGEWYGGWNCSFKDVGNHSSQHNNTLKMRKQEMLWTNY